MQNYGTTVSAGGNATLAALGGDLKASGVTLTSGGATTLLAAKTLDLGSVTNSQSSAISGRKSGFLTHSSFSNSESSSTDVGTTVAAGTDLTTLSGGDTHIAGMMGGAGDVMVQSGGAFTEDALHSAASEASSHHVSGLHLSTQGASGTVGYGSRTDAQSVSSSTYTPSVVASTGGSLSIGAKGPVKIDGSVVAAAKDLGISGSSVVFTTEQNSQTQTAMHKDKSIGVTGGISPDSMVGQAVNGALQNSLTRACSQPLRGSRPGLARGCRLLEVRPPTTLSAVRFRLGSPATRAGRARRGRRCRGLPPLRAGRLRLRRVGMTPLTRTMVICVRRPPICQGRDVALAAQKELTLQSVVNTNHTKASSRAVSASVGIEVSVGVQKGDLHGGVSVTASASVSHQQSQSDSAMHVDTVVQAANSVSLSTPGTTTLNGAEVSGERVSVKSGVLIITSPQDTAHYSSNAERGGFSVSIPIPGLGVGAFGASATVSGQTVKDTYRSTESTQSGLYAGKGGLDVDVAGNTTLRLSSTADASLNHVHTGSLDAGDVQNVSH